MDTSLSKALIMVAGVLLAMIVIAFMTHSFNQMGDWATTKDSELLIEQNQEFNKEYEVYDKDLMYGVDVISCLNKALSNNKKITDKKVVNGEQYDSSYEVQVRVILKDNKLSESLQVYYLPQNVTSFSNKNEFSYTNGSGVTTVSLEKAGFEFINNSKYIDISEFDKTDNLITHTDYKVDLTSNELLLTKDSTNSDDIIKLLSASNAISEIVKNSDSKTHKDWTKAEFRSALYDLKTRKFKCTNLTYSESGRVNCIEFKEI